MGEVEDAGSKAGTARTPGSGPSTWTMWAAAPSTASWPPCGVSYFETKTSPNCIARTMAGIACRPVWWPPRCCPAIQLAYDKVSDLEAKQRADFDIRWKVALGIEVEDRPFAKSTLQLFRAQLILHDRVRSVFQRSLQFARQTGCLKGRRMKVAVDTTYILGRGAVKDTYNLLADGIVQVVRALAQLDGTRAEEWALRHGLELYFGSSVKGEAGIDWDNKKERQALLQKIVADADLVLELARQAQGRFPADSPERQAIGEAAELLGQLLLQDVERQEDGPARKDGVSRDRVPSAHDPEMRHGRKSSSKRFDGHKAAVVVDTDSQLVTAVDILPGNAGDNTGVLEPVEQSEENTGIAVEETIGDAAYGDGGTRQAFADAGRTLIAKVPGRPRKDHFPKEDFQIYLAAGTVTCPAGNVTHTLRTFGTPDQPVGSDLSGPEFSIRPGGLWRMPPAVPVRGSWRGQRPYGDSPSPRGAPATSPGLPEK